MASEEKIRIASTEVYPMVFPMTSGESPLYSLINSSVISLGNREIELQTILSQLDCVIYVKDRMGCYTYVNERAQDLFGTSVDHIIGCEDSDFFDSEVVIDPAIKKIY